MIYPKITSYTGNDHLLSKARLSGFTLSFGRLLLLSSIILLGGSACRNSDKSRLVWSDEFEQVNSLDTSKWNYETGDGCPALCGWGNNEAQLYTKDKANIHIENGLLIIEAVKKNSKWTSARITSQSKASFTHGRVEFRAKLPGGKGTWSALWMLGEEVTTQGWPACGEIDIMEHVGRNAGVIQSAMHTPSSHGDTIDKGSLTVDSFQSEFHIYEANWTKDKIQFLADGVNYYTYEPALKNKTTWPFDSPFYIIMNVAMGGNFGGHEIDPAITNARMEVDYVRVYQ